MKQNFYVLLTFVLLTFVLFWPVFLGKVNLNGHMLVSLNGIFGENISFKPIGSDQLRIYYPSYSFTVSELKNFRIPLWNPYSFAGQPHVAELQSVAFYPLNIFALVLPFDAFWNFMRLSPSILAAFFMYLYLKRLKLSQLAAIFGALSWGFGPFILTWGEEQIITPHAVLWLPLALYGVEGLATGSQRVRRFSFGLIAASVAASLLAGFIQLSLYLLVFVVLYALLIFKFGKKLVLSLGAVFLGTGLIALQLAPSIELFLDSPRAGLLLKETSYKFLLPFYSMASYLAPDLFGSPATYNFFREGAALYYEGILYVGIAVLIFALFSLFDLKNRLVVFFGWMFIVSLMLTIDSPIARFVMNLPLPIISSSIANRILFVPAFCLVMLAAIGFNRWLGMKKSNIKKTLVPMFFAYVLLFMAIFLVKIFSNTNRYQDLFSIAHANVALRNLVLPFGVFIATTALIVFANFKPKYKRWGAILIVVLATLHTFYFGSKFFSFSERKFVFPQTGAITFLKENQDNQRVWAQGTKYLENNFATYYQLNWPEGYKSLFIKSYWELVQAVKGEMIPSRADVGFGALGDVENVIERQGMRRLFDMLAIKYVVTDKSNSERFQKANFEKVFEDGGIIVVENKQVRPRVFLASNYEGPPDVIGGGESEEERAQKEEARKALIVEKFVEPGFDWQNTLVLEKPSPISPQFGPGEATILKYSPQEILVKTSSVSPKLLYISDNYYPGWKATVDGDRTEILRANYAFMALPLTPGEHTVRFYFDSDSFKFGLLISAVSLAVILVLTLKRNRLVG